VFFAFDLMFDDGYDLREQPLIQRKTQLERLVSTTLHGRDAAVIRYGGHLETAGDAVLRSACRMSLEGIVSKRLDTPYRSGRSEAWTKSKCRGGHEVVIGGWTETGGRFRSLLVGVYRGGHLVYVGRVGTGFGQATVSRLFPRLPARFTIHTTLALISRSLPSREYCDSERPLRLLKGGTSTKRAA